MRKDQDSLAEVYCVGYSQKGGRKCLELPERCLDICGLCTTSLPRSKRCGQLIGIEMLERAPGTAESHDRAPDEHNESAEILPSASPFRGGMAGEARLKVLDVDQARDYVATDTAGCTPDERQNLP